jgi:hypothetical protein
MHFRRDQSTEIESPKVVCLRYRNFTVDTFEKGKKEEKSSYKTPSVSITKPIFPICDAIMDTVCVLLESVFLHSMSIRRIHRLAVVMMAICFAHISSVDAFGDGTYETGTLSRAIFGKHQVELRRRERKRMTINRRVTMRSILNFV